MEIEIKKLETTKEEEKSKNNESLLESVWNKINLFYNKNKKELIVVLCLLIVYNFMCPISYESVSTNKQFGGEGEGLAQLVQGASPDAPAAAPPPAAAPDAAPAPSEKDAKKAEKLAEKEAKKQAKQTAKQMPGKDSKIKLFAKNLKGVNVLQKMLGWMLSLVQSLMTFAGLVLVLAILPGLPIFIFMLILFFILRARVAAIKAY
jgi:hypothetical protein